MQIRNLFEYNTAFAIQIQQIFNILYIYLLVMFVIRKPVRYYKKYTIINVIF